MSRSLACLLVCVLCLGAALCSCTGQSSFQPDGPVPSSSPRDPQPEPEDEILDGGVHNHTHQTPEIKSSEPVSCSIRFASGDMVEFENGYQYPGWDRDDLLRFCYFLSMEEREDAVRCTVRKNDRFSGRLDAEFLVDSSALERLGQVLTEQGIEKYNGTYYHVDGLPEEFGCDVEVEYRSGERLSVHDNQSNRLSLEEMIAIRDLFLGLMDESGVMPKLSEDYNGIISPALGYAMEGTRITPEEICALDWNRTSEIWEDNFSFSLVQTENGALLQAMVCDAQSGEWLEIEDKEISAERWAELRQLAAGWIPRLENDLQEETALDATEERFYLEGREGWNCECYPPSGENTQRMMELLLELTMD